MGSGNRYGRRHSFRLSLPSAAQLLLVAIFAVSCQGRSSFPRDMERLDAALSVGKSGTLDRAFDRAYRSASGTADWLSVLKRARAGGGNGRFLESAERAVRAMPSSEPLAAAYAYALLRLGEPREAFALFQKRLSPEERPGLWAESFLVLARSGKLAEAGVKPDDFARLAALQGSPRPLSGAAILALVGGERAEAAAFASEARDAGLRMPAALLWDCGLLKELAAESDSAEPDGAEALDLAIMGDAAWTVGDPELARLRWESSIAMDPFCSFKPYAKLAMTAGDAARSDSYRRRMKAAFLDSPRASAEAAVAYAAPLVASGRFAEASTSLKPFPEDWKARALGLRTSVEDWPEERLAAEALRFAAEAPAEATGFALAILFELGCYEDMTALFESAEARGCSYRDRWFFAAAASASKGDFASAAAAAEGVGTPEAGLALGIAYRAMGRPERAASPLADAAVSLESPSARCAAYKELGGALRAMGDAEGAARAYNAAASADPADSEAAFLARGRL